MLKNSRNVIAKGPWLLKKVEDLSVCKSFDCSDKDLNDYFRVDVSRHQEELVTQTYCLHLKSVPNVAIALLDLCNDAVRLEDYKSIIDIDFDYQNLPAVKLTRFGVHKDYQRRHIGTHALNIIKELFMTDNRTGCRFIIVDAYNKKRVINFYKKNGFDTLTEKDKTYKTRAMYFDLKSLVGTI